MMKLCSVLTVLLVVCSFALVESDISLDGITKCGQKTCKRDQYCSKFHNACEPCSSICEEKTHNFDKTECQKSCQDYLHDSRYVLKEGGSGDEHLRATVQRLSHMITVTLVLVCFMLVALATVLCIQLYKWKKNKNITLASIKAKFFSKKNEPTQNKPPPNHVNNEKPDLRLEIPAESTHSGNSPVTVTTSISRRPAEDSTLDYAYDNPAMSPSTNSPNKSVPGSF